jgi:signal peptidase I
MEGSSSEPRHRPWWRTALYGRNPRATLARCAVLVVASAVVFKVVLIPIRVTGVSMVPTYADRSVNFVNRLAYLRHEPQRGDVVAIRLSEDREEHRVGSLMYMKRIVGLPGETIAFHEGRILINGHVLEEPYLKLPCNWEQEAKKIPLDEYYVVGDNRSMPWRYHDQGMTERWRIVGKVFL